MRYFIYCRKSSEGEERQVLSLASQQETLAKAFGDKEDIEFVGQFEESKSAKAPGRPLFREMLQRIEAGEADGIVSWAPDRLARNSIDGGHVIYLLDRGVLRDLKFATYTFENNSQGKFMLSIMFGQSKYYSDALSDNVKRGNATKIAMGWRPNRPPLGYLNCPATRTIIPDPDLFPLVRRLFDLFLTGAYSPRQLGIMAQDDWGFLTPRKTRSGGKPLDRSSLYKMLKNPFYAGILEWGGTTYPGSHEPLISKSEYGRAQQLLGGASVPKPLARTFAFTGLISCGACGRSVTAESKINKYSRSYTYYHCAARSRISRACGERSVEERALEKQFIDLLESLALPKGAAAWARAELRVRQKRTETSAAQITQTRNKALTELGAQLRELMSLRMRRMIDDQEFVRERENLESARNALENGQQSAPPQKVIELLDITEKVSIYAVKWFVAASPELKRRILKTVCSNSTLADKKLSIQAVKPLVTYAKSEWILQLRTVVDDVRIKVLGKELLARLLDFTPDDIELVIARFRHLEFLCSGPDRSSEAPENLRVG